MNMPYVHDRFFNGYNPYRKGVRKKAGIISPYDEIIKENAKKIGWDWKLFAALVWSESRFRIQASSPRGAMGLMQMMPRTADRYDIENLLDPRRTSRLAPPTSPDCRTSSETPP